MFCGCIICYLRSEKSISDSSHPWNAAGVKYFKIMRVARIKCWLDTCKHKICDRHQDTQHLQVMVARIVHITLVILYLCVVISLSEITHLMAIIYMVYPENASVEPTEKHLGRNFIDAPLLCPYNEGRDRHGNCREIYWTAYRWEKIVLQPCYVLPREGRVMAKIFLSLEETRAFTVL